MPYGLVRRLNRVGDEGVKVLCESLRTNQSIEKLNLAANSGGKVSGGTGCGV